MWNGAGGQREDRRGRPEISARLIREDIRFHEGWGKLTAEDVVYTYNGGHPVPIPEAVHDTLPRPDIGTLELLSKSEPRMHLNSFSVSTMLSGVSAEMITRI